MKYRARPPWTWRHLRRATLSTWISNLIRLSWDSPALFPASDVVPCASTPDRCRHLSSVRRLHPLRIAFRPRGFSPPRRLAPLWGVQACCSPVRTGFAVFPDAALAPIASWTNGPRSDQSSNRTSFPTTRFVPFEAFPSSAAGSHHCDPLPSCRCRPPHPGVRTEVRTLRPSSWRRPTLGVIAEAMPLASWLAAMPLPCSASGAGSHDPCFIQRIHSCRRVSGYRPATTCDQTGAWARVATADAAHPLPPAVASQARGAGAPRVHSDPEDGVPHQHFAEPERRSSWCGSEQIDPRHHRGGAVPTNGKRISQPQIDSAGSELPAPPHRSTASLSGPNALLPRQQGRLCHIGAFRPARRAPVAFGPAANALPSAVRLVGRRSTPGRLLHRRVRSVSPRFQRPTPYTSMGFVPLRGLTMPPAAGPIPSGVRSAIPHRLDSTPRCAAANESVRLAR
jgi:hypothetical protein